MYLDVVFTCGCCVRLKSKTGEVNTSVKCPNHGRGVSAVSQGKRTRSEYKVKNFKVVMCPASELDDYAPNFEGYEIVRGNKAVDFPKGKRIAILGATSLEVIAHCLKEAKSVFVHTEVPVVFRMCKMPDIIQTLLFKGKKAGNKNAKKAS